MEAKWVGVDDFDISHKIDAKRGAALVDHDLWLALGALVVDGRQLEDGEDHNHQGNDNQEQEQTDAAGKATTGRADAREAGQVL